jgi:thiol-disulfide isomerase/thioredoxin
MRKRLLKYGFLLVLAISLQDLIAQEGIRFEQAAWTAVLSKAKAENKLVFIDVYTSWCGPCKIMVRDVFPQKVVGDKFNASFINFKIDAEKGEGIDVAKKYAVKAYPTYLFVNGDGTLVYRSVGSMPVEKFLSEAAIAIGEFSDPKPFAVWEDEYGQNLNNKQFLWDYLQKRKKLRLNCGDVIDRYFSVSSKEEILQSPLMKTMAEFQNFNVDGPFYQFLLNNKDEIKPFLSAIFRTKFDAFLVYIAKADIDRAASNADEKLLGAITSALLKLPADEYPMEFRVGETRMKYFTQTSDAAALTMEVNLYATSVMGYDTKKIRTADSMALDQFEKDLAAGKLKFSSNESLEQNRRFKGSSIATSYAYRVRDIARSVLNVIDDKKQLAKAYDWMLYASGFSDNFTIGEVKAGLLQKLGKSKEALSEQQAVINAYTEQMAKLNISSDKVMGRLEGNLQKMKEDKPTWGIDKNTLQTRVTATPKLVK